MPSSPIVSTIRIEGGLFPSGFLGRLAALDDGLDQLTPSAYGCLPGETLRDAITDAWNRLQRVWASFQAHRATAPADGDATGDTRQRWLLPFFQVLGYQDLERAPAPEIDGKTYRLSHLYHRVPIHLIGHRLDLDKRIAGAAGAAASNAHGLVQEFLNRSAAHQWGIVANGLHLRLLRDNASLTRQAYLEVDLETLFEQHAYHDFVQIWLLLHASRFRPVAGITAGTEANAGAAHEAIIDRWYATGTKEGVRALDRLRHNVQAAIVHLGRGFLTSVGPGNRALREALAGDRLSAQDYYRELLRTVYRLLFCFVAEDRQVLLLPNSTAMQRDRYARWYATSRLRRLAASRAGTPHGDGWKSLHLIFGWLSSDSGCPTLGVPALGSLLWSREATPHLDTCNLSNQALFAALRSLAVTIDHGVRRPIDFKNLGAEELGGIYESLLELHPEISVESNAFTLKSVAGSERKTTGSYYTPTSLIKCLLDSALDPVLEAAANKATPAEAEQAILDLTVVDPACGSGHFLVAAAHRIAKRLASVRTGDLEPAPEPVRHALRDVISRCIYGVDLNPMSVELCKVSLWLEAIDPGRPLSFLDHRIRCGNSLIGTTPDLVAKGVPDEAFDPITGDDKDICKQAKKSNKSQRAQMGTQQTSLFAVMAPITAMPLDDLRRGDDATLAGVTRLAQAWATVEQDPTQQRAHWAADAWVAAFLAPKTAGAPTITSDAVRIALQTGPNGIDPQQRAIIERMAEEYRVFHWHIAFPELFGDGRPNGFSVVLGNPPWEHTELKEVEWFASRDEQIANASTGADRKRRIAALERENPTLWQTFCQTLRHHTAIGTYAGSSGRYPLCGRGRINTFAIFSELIAQIVNPRGFAGFIVPFGIATQSSTSGFFQHLVGSKRISSLFQFENIRKIFPAVHPDTPFVLLTITGIANACAASKFSFCLECLDWLSDPDRQIRLSPDDIERINPNTKTCPIFRTRRDAEITKSIYQRVPVLIREANEGRSEENPWGVTFRQGLFNMTSDSHLFKTRADLESDGWTLHGNHFHKDQQVMLPLYEAKMFHHFDHRWATYDGDETTDVTSLEKDDPNRCVFPRYWVIKKSVFDVLRHTSNKDYKWLLGFRLVSNTTNERTFVTSPIPLSGLGNSSPIIFSNAEARLSGSLYANLTSFVFDWITRCSMAGVNLNFFVVNQLPVLDPKTYDRQSVWCDSKNLNDWILPYVMELMYTANDLVDFAKDCGHLGAPFRWNQDRRRLLRAELDAAFFHLYELSRDDIAYILESFSITKRRDESLFGEYRTKRLILEAYDALAEAIRTGRPFQTKLDPPPADPRCAHGYVASVAVSASQPLAPAATLTDWTRAAIVAVCEGQLSQSIKRLRLTQYVLARPALVAELVPGASLRPRTCAACPTATTAQVRDAIHQSLDWATGADALQRTGNGMVAHDEGFAHELARRPWLPTWWSGDELACARQAADAALRLLNEVDAGRPVQLRSEWVTELQSAAA